MRASKPKGRSKKKRRRKKSLLSHSSVLVFSAFLIGAVAHQVVPVDMHVTVLAVGVVGLLSYVVLDIAAARRREHREELAERQAVHQLEGRLSQHVASWPGGRSQQDP